MTSDPLLDPPRPVQVRYPNGLEEIGLWVASDAIEVGGIGLLLDVRDELLLDDEIFYVYGTSKRMKNGHGIRGVGGAEVTVRVRVGRENR